MPIKSVEPDHSALLAEQMVTKLSRKLRWAMTPAMREGLTHALIKSGAAGDLMFRNKPYHPKTPWTISGVLARIMLAYHDRLKPDAPFGRSDERDDPKTRLAAIYYQVKCSGAVALTIALLIALFVGMSGIFQPLETGLQIGRDAVRRHAASGDIVVIAKDDRSAKIFGGLPWPRRYDAQLVDKLRAMGAKRIVFNQAMADPSNPIDDAALAAAFDRAGGKVWLGVNQERDRVTGKLEPVLPISLFRERTQQAHLWVGLGIFGHIEQIANKFEIGGKAYPSQAAVLADTQNSEITIRPDNAFDHRTIPTYSASDVVHRRINNAEISGKTVFVVVTSDMASVTTTVFPYDRVASGYSIVVAAETLKSGIARDLGFLLPLLVVALIGIACVTRSAPRPRGLVILAGVASLAGIMFGGDRLGLHVEMVPALLALVIFAFRETIRSSVMAGMTTDAMTGLPNLAHLRQIRRYKDATVVVLKFDRYEERTAELHMAEQRAIARAISGRIAIAAPGCIVHQGVDGLFALLVPPRSEVDAGTIAGQLTALFALDVVGLDASYSFDVSVAADGDPTRKFASRLLVACDRAERGIYITPRLAH